MRLAFVSAIVLAGWFGCMCACGRQPEPEAESNGASSQALEETPEASTVPPAASTGAPAASTAATGGHSCSGDGGAPTILTPNPATNETCPKKIKAKPGYAALMAEKRKLKSPSGSGTWTPPPVSAAVVKRQDEFLAAVEAKQAAWETLSEREREQARADLKQKMLGDMGGAP